VAPIDIATSLDNLKLERDAIAMYDALAGIERDPHRRAAFERIAGNERRHADIWAAKLEELGADIPPPPRGPRARVRVIILIARLFGTRAVADMVKALEGDEEELYESFQATAPEVAAIAEDEREHARIWERLSTKGADEASRDGEVSVASVARSISDVGQREAWHRTGGRSGTLRAVIFGVSDGLVSNLALVMGVAGAAADQGNVVLVTGIAGLLAGAFSMAAGEYISMQSQRELFERQIALERAEMEAMPEEEQAELASVFRAKGFTGPEAERIAARLFEQPDMALDMLVREELGLDPDELGSPWGAAAGSFVAFAIGAAIPVIPFLLTAGTNAVIASLALSLIALFVVGAGVSLLTGRGVLFSGTRQLVIGLAAAVVTYAIGSIIGVTVAG
jgi:VIT1/CCC1 family predicted Fe2+/Mn2+ transporter/rubrerythrin